MFGSLLLGNSGTDTPPAHRMAMSAISHHGDGSARIPTVCPGFSPSATSPSDIRRTVSPNRSVEMCSHPPSPPAAPDKRPFRACALVIPPYHVPQHLGQCLERCHSPSDSVPVRPLPVPGAVPQAR